MAMGRVRGCDAHSWGVCAARWCMVVINGHGSLVSAMRSEADLIFVLRFCSEILSMGLSFMVFGWQKVRAKRRGGIEIHDGACVCGGINMSGCDAAMGCFPSLLCTNSWFSTIFSVTVRGSWPAGRLCFLLHRL